MLSGKSGLTDTTVSTASAKAEKQPKLELLLPFRWPDTSEPVQWCITVEGAPEKTGRVYSLEEIEEESRSFPLTVFLDAADALLMKVTLPAMSRKNLAKAIPYALEDRLLGDIEEQFFVWKKNTDDSTSVCVLTHERIKAILEELNSHQLQPDALLPILFSAPMLDNSWTLVFGDRNAWLRTGKTAGVPCSIEATGPPYALVRLLADARDSGQAPSGLLLVNSPESVDAKYWASQLGLEIFIPDGHLWENMDRGEPPMNLLQPPYTARKAASGSLRRLLPAAVMATILVVGNAGVLAWNWISLHREAGALNNRMVQIFKQSFPEQASTVIDPAAQMQKNLDRLRQEKGGARQNDFLALLGPTSKALSNNHVDDLSSIRYRGGSIQISIELADYQALDKLKLALGSHQLVVEVIEANSDSSGVRAVLKIVSVQEAAS